MPTASAIDLARSNITTAAANYNLELAGNTPDSIAAQEAAVEQAQANIDAAQAQLDKSIIYSPIDGVITNVNAKVGETMQSGLMPRFPLFHTDNTMSSHMFPRRISPEYRSAILPQQHSMHTVPILFSRQGHQN